MIHLLVLAVAALHLQDPAGDAVGDGTLAPPTAPVYANTADFDLQAVTLTSDPNLTVRVQLGAVSDAAGLPNGFSNPILEIYLDTKPGGAQQLLPGSSMAMPPKHGWEIALRATGDEAYAVEAQAGGSPASWPRLPVTVEVQGNTITLHTQIPRPSRADVYALTGVYDPFTADGWRPLTSSVSPWAFSSASQQVPVVDLLASSQSAQRREIDSGVLAPFRSPLHGVGWLLLMVLGLITAAAGLVLRRRVRAPDRPAAARGAAPPTDGVGPAAPDAGDGREAASRLGEAGAASSIHERFLDEEEEAELWPDAEASVDRAVAGVAGAALAGEREDGHQGPASDGAAHVAGEDTAEEATAREATAREDAAGEDTSHRVPLGDTPAGDAAPVEDAAHEGTDTAADDETGTDDRDGEDDADEDDADEAEADEADAGEEAAREEAADEDEAGTGAAPGPRRP